MDRLVSPYPPSHFIDNFKVNIVLRPLLQVGLTGNPSGPISGFGFGIGLGGLGSGLGFGGGRLKGL